VYVKQLCVQELCVRELYGKELCVKVLCVKELCVKVLCVKELRVKEPCVKELCGSLWVKGLRVEVCAFKFVCDGAVRERLVCESAARENVVCESVVCRAGWPDPAECHKCHACHTKAGKNTMFRANLNIQIAALLQQFQCDLPTVTCKTQSESQDITEEQVPFEKPWRSHFTKTCTG